MKTLEFINLTPHTVNICNPETEEITHSYPSQGSARVKTEQEETENPLIKHVKYTELQGLPKPKEGVMYILSTIAYDAAKEQGRKDICFPSGRMFRDENKQIKGVEYLGVKEKYTSKSENDGLSSIMDRLFVDDIKKDSKFSDNPVKREKELYELHMDGLKEAENFFNMVKSCQQKEKFSELSDEEIKNCKSTIGGYNFW